MVSVTTFGERSLYLVSRHAAEVLVMPLRTFLASSTLALLFVSACISSTPTGDLAQRELSSSDSLPSVAESPIARALGEHEIGRAQVTTRFRGPDGDEQVHSFTGIRSDFAPHPGARVISEYDLRATVSIDLYGVVESVRFQWPDVFDLDTTTVGVRRIRRETEASFRAALRLNPFIVKYNNHGIFRPDTLELRISFDRPRTIILH